MYNSRFNSKKFKYINLDATVSHYVQINHPDDVVEALAFAEQHNLMSDFIGWKQPVITPTYSGTLGHSFKYSGHCSPD